MLASIVLVYFILVTGKGLFTPIEELVANIEQLTPIGYIRSFVLMVIGLLFVQWQAFGPFGAAPFTGASLLLYLVILYEIAGAIWTILARESHLNFNRQIAQVFPIAVKIPTAIELAIFLYLLARPFLIFL